MVQRISAEILPITGEPAVKAVPRTAVAPDLRAWRFDGFEFDLRRSELHGRSGEVIALRPKAEALLRQFLLQPGRLLSKDELMAAVWPAAVVTDDSLVQCVGELRAALDGGGQRLIHTVSRRGYRFEAAVAPVSDAQRRDSSLAQPISPAAPATQAQQPAPAALDPTARRPVWGSRAVALMLLAVAAALVGGAVFYSRLATPPIRIDEEIAARATVAVLPFVLAANEPALRSAADAAADAIAAQFSTRIGMRGIGRAATAAYDGAAPPLALLASQLKATHVVTGRVAPADAGARMAIDVQIITVANGEVIWARRFESSDASATVVPADIGQHVVIAMRRRGPLEASLRAAQRGHTPDAADLALLGWGDLDGRKSLADVQRARARFEAALRDDARSVIALNGLSASYFAERIDPLNQLTVEQVAEHERVTGLASQLAPDNDTTLVQWGHMQIMRGRPDLALPAYEKASRLVPSQPSAYVHVATARLLLGRADEVQALADRALALGAGDARRVSPAYLIAAEAALLLGDDERARDQARRAIAELPASARALATLAAIDALGGRNEQAAAEMAAVLKLWPTATVANFDALRRSTQPVYLAQRQRLYEGLRKAGLPEK